MESQSFHFTGDSASLAQTFSSIGHTLLREDLKRIANTGIPDLERDPEAFMMGFIIGVASALERIMDGRLSIAAVANEKPPGPAAPKGGG